MSGSAVIPRLDSGKLALIEHSNAGFPIYAATQDFRADDLAELNSATAWLKYGLDLQSTGEAAVASKNAVRDGSPTRKAFIPSLPTLKPPPGEPFFRVFGYLFNVITRIRIHKPWVRRCMSSRCKAPPWTLPPCSRSSIVFAVTGNRRPARERHAPHREAGDCIASSGLWSTPAGNRPLGHPSGGSKRLVARAKFQGSL